MDIEQFNILYDVFGESLDLQRNSSSKINGIFDGVQSISTNLEEVAKLYKEKLEEEKKLSESVPQMASITSPTSMSDMATVSFYIEQQAILMDKVFGLNGHLFMDTMFSIDKGIQLIAKQKAEISATQPVGGAQLGADMRTLDQISQSINLFVSSINTSVNKRYVKNIATFNKSISVLMKGIKDAVEKLDKQSLDTFSKASMFVVDYTRGVAEIDSRNITDRKIRAIKKAISIFNMQDLKDVSIENMKAVAESMSVFSVHLKPFMDSLSKSKMPSQRRIQRIMNSLGEFVKSFSEVMKNGDASKMKATGDMLSSIGTGIRKFAWRIFIASPLLVLAVPGMTIFKFVVKFLRKELQFIADNAEGLNRGAVGIAKMGLSVLAFAGSMALTTLIMRQIDVRQLVWGLAITSATMYGMSRLFMYFGNSRNSRRIVSGAKAIAFMSVSLVIGALSLYGVSQVGIDFVNVGILALSLSALAVVYHFIGKSWVTISKGALAMSVMSLSIYLVSASIAFSSMVAMKSWKGALIFMGLASGIATIWGVAGMFFGYIALGAGAMALVGLSLLTFALPLKMVGEAMEKSGDALIKHLPEFIRELVIPMSMMGIASPLILLGSVALGAVGASLLPFTKVFEGISKSKVQVDDVSNFSKSMTILAKGASDALSELSFLDTFRLGSLRDVASIVDTFSTSMVKFSTLGDTSKLIDISRNIGEMFKNIMHSVIIATSPDAIKKMYDIDTNWLKIQGSITSASRMSSAMIDLADGVRKWTEMKIDEGDGQKIADNIKSILGIIPASIAPMGRFFDDDDDMWNLWGILRKSDKDVEEKRKFEYLNGQTFSLREVRNGLRFTAKLGDSLGDLADGVKKWAEMKLSSSDVEQIDTNIRTILGVLPRKIADFGAIDKDEVINAGFLGLFQKSSVERGLEYTGDLGGAINSLADGVRKWRDAKLTSADVERITSNLQTIMGVLPALVSQFGEQDKDVIPTGFMGMILKTTVQRGIDYVKGIGEALIPLYDGVVKWKTTKISDEERTAIQKNIEGILTTIPQVFMSLAEDADKGTGIFGIADSDLQKGVDAVKMFNEPLNMLVGTIKNYSSIKDADISSLRMGATLKKTLQMINEGFSFLTPHKVDTFSKFIKPFSEFTKILTKFGKDMKDVSADWKSIESVIDKANSFEQNRSRSSYSFPSLSKPSGGSFASYQSSTGFKIEKSNKETMKVDRKAGETPEQLRTRQIDKIIQSMGMILDALGYRNSDGAVQQNAVASILSDLKDLFMDGNAKVRVNSKIG